MTVVKDAIAYDAKARRAMRNKARRNGDPMGLLDNNQGGKVDNLLSTYQRAKAQMGIRSALSGRDEDSRKAKKALNNHWYNRGQNVQDFLCNGKPVTIGKEKRRGKSKPLI